MRTLIAEDDLTSRTMLAAVLSKCGYEVVETVDGHGAWEALQRADAPQLVILDWMMPGMDGLEVCRKLRAMDTDCPPYVIMLTALADKERLVTALNAGADDYMVKPFEIAELQARIAVGARIVNLQQRLAREATTDELTGLHNRRAGLEALRREVARSSREGQRLGVGILDVDHFKQVNDTYGHPAGDDVLRELAARLSATLRPYDHLSRHGGEEFLVVVPNGGRGPAPWERLRAAVAGSPFPTRAGQLDVTISLGHSSGDGRSDPEELIAAADRALYRAKEAGRNRVEHQAASEGAGDAAANPRDLRGAAPSPGTGTAASGSPDGSSADCRDRDCATRD
ncbi:MAG: diguanylate cyclase [Deltaproteobacteria bacterium]|nr:diguanylate cyclase [Deltaproteobacteria bacterium]